ncbi:neutral/alkaline non-lysosomal ceramidase N-terminal domain-containing protein [Paenibacillus sp. V4I5]|uniref:neutral/alkaline non-lysosomal ceramidase N-terminal domain-containing protein n=1 Tax=Paenibacillus sp. V4I5 TaxID=3042306 RepID=UPI0027922B36|nr:neutral/alkaline non-lysosomal ceramidase N-terminal domain-containing protein [Paenibacillus sp. V4I5]MDQ0920257.1 neutral ceramidase [Paenibacillus sp. V4I5]
MIKLGFSECTVTPPVGIWLGGFSNRTAPSTGVRDHLRAQVMWLESTDREEEHVVVVVDQVGLTRSWTDTLQERLQHLWGLRSDQVLVHWTHTHCAPLYREPTPGFEHAVFSSDYFNGLIDAIIEVSRSARDDMEPVSLFFGTGSSDLAFSRRLIVDGQNVFAANPYGVVDHDVPVVKASRSDGSCKLVLFSYACHPTITNGLLISAEFPGVARSLIEKRIPGTQAMFLQGCGADAVVGVVSSEKERYLLQDQWEDVEAAGRSLAWKVLLTLAHQMEPVIDDTLAGFTESCYPTFEYFPARIELEERAKGEHVGDSRWANFLLQRFPDEPIWPLNIEARVHGLRLGDIYFLGHPGEVVAAYGLRLKERHPKLRLITLGYCHSQIGYIPRRSMYDEGGYEVDAWRTWGYPSRWDRNIEQLFESTAETVLLKLKMGETP